MGINAFFAEKLNAPFHDRRKSWGAKNSSGKFVFLRVAEGSVYTDGKNDWVEVLNDKWDSGFGFDERMTHLKLIANGAKGFAVTCDFSYHKSIDQWKLSNFNADELLELGEIVQEEGKVFAKVIRRVSVSEFSDSGFNSIVSDVKAALQNNGLETTAQRLIDARVGQGKFRKEVLQLWGNKCAVSEISVLCTIRASHVKPWYKSTNGERLDPENGIPLVATYDALFDGGLITFDEQGGMKVSSLLDERDRSRLGLTNLRLSKKPTVKMQRYLAFHMKDRFKP